ncbi:hypothetical protein H0H93_000898 [Arthromyces matolae]|nr:hypothetical protein H0H93_000898 [Arthromyces matolae]
MPEFRETLAHFFIVIWLWFRFRFDYSWTLLALWVDFTEKEARNSRIRKIPGAKEGHVCQLLAEHPNIKRGTNGSQDPVFPPHLCKTKSNPNPPPLDSFTLRDVKTTNRALILDFGSLYLKFSYLTHCSVQFYTSEKWYSSVCKMPKHLRGFHIVLALEFKEYVLAFISLDLLAQPEWAVSQDDFDPTPPDVYTEYCEFLGCVVKWIKSRRDSARSGRACDIIRATSQRKRFSIVLHEQPASAKPSGAMHINPIQIFRLSSSLLSFVGYTDFLNISDLLKPCMREGLLAPTPEQRLMYKDWLHVFAKCYVRTSPRLADLIDGYKERLSELEAGGMEWSRDEVDLFDVFEPEYIQAAFQEKKTHLGALIFGKEEWAYLKGDIPDNAVIDPLSSYFSGPGFSSSKTYLRPSFYNTLSPNDDKRLFCQDLWRLSEAERSKMYFNYIVKHTNTVSIGPLEYCGTAHVRYTTHGEPIVLSVNGNPTVPKQMAIRDLKGVHCTKEIEKAGHAKRRMTGAQLRKSSGFENMFRSPLHSSSPSCPPTSSDPPTSPIQPPPAKKRRVSQDMAMALRAEQENIDPNVDRLHKRTL